MTKLYSDDFGKLSEKSKFKNASWVIYVMEIESAEFCNTIKNNFVSLPKRFYNPNTASNPLFYHSELQMAIQKLNKFFNCIEGKHEICYDFQNENMVCPVCNLRFFDKRSLNIRERNIEFNEFVKKAKESETETLHAIIEREYSAIEEMITYIENFPVIQRKVIEELLDPLVSNPIFNEIAQIYRKLLSIHDNCEPKENGDIPFHSPKFSEDYNTIICSLCGAILISVNEQDKREWNAKLDLKIANELICIITHCLNELERLNFIFPLNIFKNVYETYRKIVSISESGKLDSNALNALESIVLKLKGNPCNQNPLIQIKSEEDRASRTPHCHPSTLLHHLNNLVLFISLFCNETMAPNEKILILKKEVETLIFEIKMEIRENTYHEQYSLI